MIAKYLFFFKKSHLFRSKEEFTFQAHALQNHPQSQTLFHGLCQPKTSVKTEEMKTVQLVESFEIEPGIVDNIKKDEEINEESVENESIKHENDSENDLNQDSPLIKEV